VHNRAMTYVSRGLLIGAVVALVLSACTTAVDQNDPTEATARAPSTTTTAPTATTSEESTTIASAVSTTTTAVATTVADTNELASGSGCTPGDVELPDGTWFGFVVDANADELQFDLACWFSGEAAIAATAEDGEESPPPNDYYIRNLNPAVRTLAIGEADVFWLPNTGDPASAETVEYGEWMVYRDARPEAEFQPGVWVTITDGVVTHVEEQYVP